MKLLSYPVFLILNSLYAIALIVLPFILPSSELSAPLFVGLGSLVLVSLALSQHKPVNIQNLIPTRIVALIVMVAGIVVAFLPYLLQFQSQRVAIGATTTISALMLLTLLFSTLTLNDEEA